MFGVTAPRRWVGVFVFGLLAMTLVGLVGCGKEEVDPYVYDSVRRIMEGDTTSVDFLFEIEVPDFDYVRGNVAMIRNGNLLNFLVAENMEANYRNLSGALLGVRKTFTPQPTHLVLHRVKRNGVVEADSLPVPQYVLPRLLRAGAVDQELAGAPLPELGWKSKDINEATSTYLPENEGDPAKTVQSAFERVALVPRHDLPDSVRPNPTPDDFAWYAVGLETSLEIVGLTPGAEWMLNMLIAKDLPLVGAFTVDSLVEEYRDRKVEHEGLGHVVGTVKLNWFKFGNTFVQGSGAD